MLPFVVELRAKRLVAIIPLVVCWKNECDQTTLLPIRSVEDSKKTYLTTPSKRLSECGLYKSATRETQAE